LAIGNPANLRHLLLMKKLSAPEVKTALATVPDWKKRRDDCADVSVQ
jgi:hypothetical protein